MPSYDQTLIGLGCHANYRPGIGCHANLDQPFGAPHPLMWTLVLILGIGAEACLCSNLSFRTPLDVGFSPNLGENLLVERDHVLIPGVPVWTSL